MKPVLLSRTVVLLMGAAVLTSCGSGESEPEPGMSAGGPPTKAEYLKRANAICVQQGAEIAGIATRSDGRTRPSPEQMREYTRATDRVQADTIARLRALQPPAGDEATVAAIYDSMQQAMVSLRPIRANAPSRPGKEPPAFTEFQRLATAYGLTSCAER